MAANEDTTHLGLTWPEEYLEILPVLRREWGIEDRIFLTRRLGGGKSGALVYFVDISTKRFTGQAILKLDQATDPTWQQQHEAELHETAIRDAPEFAAKHLPRLLHSSHDGKRVALLSTIAGRGLEYVEPWIDCSYDRKLRSARTVSVDILENWNSDYRLSSGMLAPRDLLRGWLDFRLDSLEGGRIHAFLAQDCGIPVEVPTIMVAGQWYPNPLAFADGAVAIPKSVRLRCARGHCHCDLHGLNLLVGRKGKRRLDYYLIDLAMYESDQFLFYDQAIFELSSLLLSRSSSSAGDWLAVVTQLSNFHAGDGGGLRTDDIGLIKLVRTLRQGVSDWIERHEADRLSFMESQTLLARIAAGLNFSHKRISQESRRMAFFYAASNLKDYLILNQLDWQKSGVDFKIGAMDTGPTGHRISTDRPPAELSRKDAGETKSPAAPPAEVLKEQASGNGKLKLGWVGHLVLAGLAVAIAVVIALVMLPGRDHAPSSDEKGASNAVVPSRRAGPPEFWNSDTSFATSLAVMPFKNLNSDSDDSFAQGLTIEIANVLAHSGHFRMPSMSSALRIGASIHDFRAIGEALNVDYLVEGTILRSGDHLKITASLTRAGDGILIWSSTFDDEMKDVFATQENIAEAIGAALSTPLDIDSDVLEAQRSSSPQAYELFVRGLALLEQRGKALAKAKTVLERAVEIHPDFAAAWGALSLVYNVIPSFLQQVDGRPVDAAVYYRKAKEAALQARRIDPDLPIARHALAYMYQRERLWISAEREYQAALLNDPSAHRIMLDYAGLLYTVGKRSEALDLTTRAKTIDPANELYVFWDAFLHWQRDQTEANIDVLEDMFENSSQYREFALRIIIGHRAMKGELNSARDLIEDCSECSGALRNRALAMLDAASHDSAVDLFASYRDTDILGYQLLYSVGGPDIALEAFRYYGIEAQRRLIFFTVPWTLADQLVPHRQFQEIARDMGLVSYWRSRGWPDDCEPTADDELTCEPGG